MMVRYILESMALPGNIQAFEFTGLFFQVLWPALELEKPNHLIHINRARYPTASKKSRTTNCYICSH